MIVNRDYLKLWDLFIQITFQQILYLPPIIHLVDLFILSTSATHVTRIDLLVVGVLSRHIKLSIVFAISVRMVLNYKIRQYMIKFWGLK